MALNTTLGAPPARAETWAEKLGYPAGRKVLILHADDIGMSWEANVAAERYFQQGLIQSGSAMAPCPWFADAVAWARENPGHDLGLHLTLNSEWQDYRWGPTAKPGKVFTLLDGQRYLHRGVQKTFFSSRRQVLRELRSQLRKAHNLGFEPTHLDTHMGSVFVRPDFLKAYLQVSRESGIPAMTMADVRATVECLFSQDSWSRDLVVTVVRGSLKKALEDYPFPSLDVLCSVPRGESYEEVRDKLLELIRSLQPGLTAIFFHPSVETDGFKRITNSWPQRVWESQIFADPEVIEFFEREEVIFTTWREMMSRYDERYQAR